MRFKIFLKSLWGYLGIILLFTFISNFVDANLGSTLLYTFSALLCLSVIAVILSVIFTSVSPKNEKVVVSKNQRTFFVIDVKSKLPIALSFINLVMEPQKYLLEENLAPINFMVDKFHFFQINVEYKTKVFGKDVVAAKELVFRDFMGLIEIKKSIKDVKLEIMTLPVYRETMYDKSIMQLTNYCADFDDSEEISGSVFGLNGFPGYEHREYVKGDSRKRINYKLSAKKDKLMVRLDEPIASMRQAVILDCVSYGDRYKDEIAIEGMLAYVGYLIKNTIMTEVYMTTDNGVVMIPISSFMDIDNILDACKLVNFKQDNNNKQKIEIKRISQINSIMIFTSGEKSQINLEKTLVPIFTVTSMNKTLAANEFYIDENLAITKGGTSNGEI